MNEGFAVVLFSSDSCPAVRDRDDVTVGVLRGRTRDADFHSGGFKGGDVPEPVIVRLALSGASALATATAPAWHATRVGRRDLPRICGTETVFSAAEGVLSDVFQQLPAAEVPATPPV